MSMIAILLVGAAISAGLQPGGVADGPADPHINGGKVEGEGKRLQLSAIEMMNPSTHLHKGQLKEKDLLTVHCTACWTSPSWDHGTATITHQSSPTGLPLLL